GAAVCVIPFLVWHVIARPLRLRSTDLGRRNFLKGGLVAASAGLAVALLPSARRAPTGSFEAAYPVATRWMFDGVPQLDARSWRTAWPARRSTPVTVTPCAWSSRERGASTGSSGRSEEHTSELQSR